MGCCKLDKIDKIFISILCIFVTSICVFNTFSFANEYLQAYYEQGLSISNKTIVNRENSTIFYYQLKKGHTYEISNTWDNSYAIYQAEDISVGTKLNYLFTQATLPYNEVRTIVAEYDMVIGTFNNTDLSNYIKVRDITTPGFKTVIADLVGLFGFGALWDVFKNLIPYILVCVSVSLGFYFILHAIKEVSKGRDV